MKVLLVEDDRALRDTMSRYLSSYLHADVTAVADCKDALNLMQHTDIVVTDWNLEYGNALQVVIRARELGIPCVVNSSMPGDEASLADAVVMKGMPDDVAKAVTRLLGKSEVAS